MICLIVMAMTIASTVWADAGKSDTAKNTAKGIVHPSHDLYRFHEWAMPLRIKYYDMHMSWCKYKNPMPVPMKQMKFSTDMIKTVDDYLAIAIYFEETKFVDQGFFEDLLLDIFGMSKMQAMVRVMIEERARQGFCDELLYYYDVGAFSHHYTPDFTAFSECINRPDHMWQGPQDTRIKFLKKVTLRLIAHLGNPSIIKKYHLEYSNRSKLRNMITNSSDSPEIAGIFFDLWKNRAKEGLKPMRRSHEHFRKKAPELLKQYGPYPKPGWTEQIAKIRSKTMKEWDEHFRAGMGDDGLHWKEKAFKNAVRRKFDSTKVSNPDNAKESLVPKTKKQKTPKVSEPEPILDQPSGNPYLPWILGILALLSVLIVSVIVIRRRGE